MNRWHGDSYSVARNYLHPAALLIFLLATFGSAAYPSLVEALTFTDDFNRPDSATVGNGWSDTAGNIGGNLAIKNNELTCLSTGEAVAGTFRPLPFTAPITTTARVKEQSGFDRFGTSLRQYAASFFVHNNGTLNHGYGVAVWRIRNPDFDISAVILVEDNRELAVIPSSFEYGPELHVSVTFNLDGSITGTVSEPAPSINTFSFSFGPRTIQSMGDNFSIKTNCSAGPVDQRIDDVTISSDSVDACAAALPFQWPVDDPNVTQVYACRNCTTLRNPRYNSGINFHSGADVKPVDTIRLDYTKPVKAAADGWVERIVEWPNSRGLGNTVILRHENGPYSLYGHLDKIDDSLFPGEFVLQGSQLGIMGNSSSRSGRDRSFGTHVHFEIKDNPALGNIADDHDYWGYTPGHPDLYHYHDPRDCVQGISVDFITPTAVQNPPPGALSVRSGPGITYFVTDGGTVQSTAVINTIRENREFVAFKRAFIEGGYWYYIHLPSTNRPLSGSSLNNGPNGGWVSGDIVVQNPFATQIEILGVFQEGLPVRSGPSTDFSVLAKTYTGQRFVTYDPPVNGVGCALPWYKIHLPNSVRAPNGWICGDFAKVTE